MSKKLTKEIVNERLKDRGIELIGEYIGDGVKTLFRGKCGHEWQSKPNNIMSRNRGCPVCGGTQRLSKEIVISRIARRGIQMIGEYINGHTKSKFKCDCGNEWSATPKNIMGGQGCPICSIKIRNNKLRLPKETINERLLPRGLSMIGDFINVGTKAEFKCVCGHIWETKPNNIIAGSGCPSCCKYGFQIDKPGYIYILIFETFIKYGITNDIKQRLKDHEKSGKFTVALTKLYEDGNQALLWERDIKIIFGGRFVSKEVMSNGHTETLSSDKLELLLDTVR